VLALAQRGRLQILSSVFFTARDEAVKRKKERQSFALSMTLNGGGSTTGVQQGRHLVHCRTMPRRPNILLRVSMNSISVDSACCICRKRASYHDFTKHHEISYQYVDSNPISLQAYFFQTQLNKHLHEALAARRSLSCIIYIITGRVYQGSLSLVRKISYTAKQHESDFFF